MGTFKEGLGLSFTDVSEFVIASSMKTEIDVATWKRKSHYDYFKTFDCPLFSTTITWDVTSLYLYAKKESVSFFLITLYVIVKAVNEVPEFRYREEEGKIYIYDTIDVVTPVLAKDGEFSQILLPYETCFRDFERKAQLLIKAVKEIKSSAVSYDASRHDYVYASCVPWYSFTGSVSAVSSFKNQDFSSVRWGKATWNESHEKMTVPLVIQCNHCFIDGVHLGRFFEALKMFSESLSKMR